MILQEEVERIGESENSAEIVEINRQLKLQIDRCAGITREILNFGRQNEPELKRIDLVDFLPQVTGLVQKKAKLDGVEIVLDVDDNVPDIIADYGLMQQVMVNLLNNALHAVSEERGSDGGMVCITAGPDGKGEVQIKVVDNGIGIHGEDMDRIFLPFFSTKKERNGTGLGLSVCHSIIDSLGGSLKVQSRRHKGTEFYISLPAACN